MRTITNETYRVTFHYSIDVTASDEYDAEELAARDMEKFLAYSTVYEIVRGMAATVEMMEGD